MGPSPLGPGPTSLQRTPEGVASDGDWHGSTSTIARGGQRKTWNCCPGGLELRGRRRCGCLHPSSNGGRCLDSHPRARVAATLAANLSATGFASCHALLGTDAAEAHAPGFAMAGPIPPRTARKRLGSTGTTHWCSRVPALPHPELVCPRPLGRAERMDIRSVRFERGLHDPSHVFNRRINPRQGNGFRYDLTHRVGS